MRKPEDYGKIKTSFTVELSKVDRKMKKIIKFIENGKIFLDKQNLSFVDPYDYGALKKDLRDRKYKEDLANSICDSYGFASVPKRRELFKLPPEDWQDPDLLKFALGFFEGPRDSDANMFGKFEAVNTNPNNLLLQLFNIKPYKYLKIEMLSGPEVERYYNIAGSKVKADKYVTILTACQQLTSEQIKTNSVNYADYKADLFSRFIKNEYFSENPEIVDKSRALADTLSNTANSNIYPDIILKDPLLQDIADKADSAFLKKQKEMEKDRQNPGSGNAPNLINAPDFNGVDYEINKIKLLFIYVSEILTELIADLKADGVNMDYFTPLYGYYDFIKFQFLSFGGTPVQAEQEKQELYFRFTYFKDDPTVIQTKYQKPLSKATTEFIKPAKKYVDTLTRSVQDQFSAVLSASETKINPTILSILSDIDFLDEVIEEGPDFTCPPMDSSLDELQKSYDKNSLDNLVDSYLKPDPDGMNAISIKQDQNKVAFFDYVNFPVFYFIPFNGFQVVDKELTEQTRKFIINNKWYYDSPDNNPVTDILKNDFYKKLFDNIFMKNGFAGFFGAKTSFLTDPKAIESIINKIISDAESSGKQALETIHKTILARTNLICLIEEVVACLFPKGINCKEILRNFRISDIEEILKKFFPETIYPDLYAALEQYMKQQMSAEQIKLKEEIEALEEDIKNNPRSVIIYSLLNSGSNPDLVRSLADIEEKKLASPSTPEKDREEILIERKKLYASLYGDAVEDNTTSSNAVNDAAAVAKKIDGFLDIIEQYVDIEILCDLARLAELFDISFTFNFNWPTFSLPSFYLDFSFSIEDVTIELLIQTILQLILGLLEELLTCNGISNLVAAAITGDNSGEGLLANVAAAANQMANDRFDLEEFAKTSGVMKNFNKAMDNLAKNLSNSIRASAAVSIQNNPNSFAPVSLKDVTTVDVGLSGIKIKQQNTNKFKIPKPTLPKELTQDINNLTNTVKSIAGSSTKYKYDSGKKQIQLKKAAIAVKNRADAITKVNKLSRKNKNNNKTSSMMTEKELKDNLISLINEISLMLEPHELINLLGGTPYEKDIEFVKQYILQNKPEIDLLADNNTLRNLFSYMANISGLDKLKDDMLNASFVRNRKQAAIKASFCEPDALSPYDLTQKAIRDKINQNDSAATQQDKIEQRKRNREKFGSIASDILKSDPSKVKKKMDDMVFKPIVVGKMPNGNKIGFLNDERNRRIDHTLKNINKDYRSVANSFYSCLTYTTSEDVKINEYKNKKGDSIESYENGQKILKEVENIEDRKPNPEFKYYESNGVQTVGKQDDEPYGRSMNVTKTKLINCGTFIQNYGSIGDNTKVKVIAEPPKEGEVTPNIDNASIEISIKGQVASHSDQEKVLELAGLFNREKWEIDYKESAIGQASINISSSRGLEINYKNIISKEDINVNSYAKYVELILSSINEGLEKTDYDKEKAVSYLRNSYQKFIAQMFSGLAGKMTEDSLLKKIKPLTPEAMNSLLQNPDIPEQLRQALSEDTVLETQIVVDTALKYINFSPNATKKQKDKKKDPSLLGVEEIKDYITQSFDKRTEDFLNRNSSLTSEQLYEKKLEENIEEGAMFDGYFLTLVRVYCSDIMLKSLFVNRTFNFDKKILQNLILPSYGSKMILQTISDFSKELNIRSLIEGTSQQIDLVYSTFYPNPEEDKFSKDILILKKNYKKIELDRNVLRRYKNDRVNPLVIMNFDRSVQIQKEIACAEQELELIRRELDFLQLRNICLKEMEIMFDKLTHITLSESSETCPERGSADKILSNLLADSDALMFDVSSDIARLKQEFENNKQLIDLEYQKENVAKLTLKYFDAINRKQIRLFLDKYKQTLNQEYPLTIDTILQNITNLSGEVAIQFLSSQEGIPGDAFRLSAVLNSINYVLGTVDENEQPIEPIYNLTFEEEQEIKNTAENIAAANLAIENEQKRRETQIYVAQMNGTLDVVSNYEKINEISSNGYLEDFRNTVVELVGGEEAFINTLKRKTKSNTRHFVEKYVRIPKVKNIPNNREYSQLKNFQDTYSLYGVVNYHNYVGFINYIKRTYPQLSKKKVFEIFDGDFKLGMRMMHLLDNKDENSLPQPSIVNDTNDIFQYLKNCKNYVVYFGDSISPARATSDDYFSSEELASFGNRSVKKEYYIDEKSHCVPHISIDSDGVKNISLLNIVPLVKEEVSISKMNNMKLEDLEWNSYDNFILNEDISAENKKLRESLFCPEIMETLSILTNQNVVVGLLGLSSIEMLSDSISASMFDSIKYKIMQKYLISWRIMNGEDAFLIAEFFDQEWILELMTALLNPKIILKASVFILQYYCRMTDPNIPIALAIRNTIKSGINISAGPFAGKLKPPENMPLPVAPFSLALLPMTVFPPPVGIGPPLTIPGMIYLGADLLLLLFDLFKDIEASADNKSLKNLLDPYCVNLKRYRKYGIEG